jgi:UDP-N-acetylglucosamine 2-epimerase (non-hydrolysing)
VFSILGNNDSIKLVNPLAYPAFVWLMKQCHLIITDSGGVQEEAPSLGKPVLVMRETTERPEAVEAGTVLLVGTDSKRIVGESIKLINNDEYYKSMSGRHNPYGNGDSSKQIVETILSLLK